MAQLLPEMVGYAVVGDGEEVRLERLPGVDAGVAFPYADEGVLYNLLCHRLRLDGSEDKLIETGYPLVVQLREAVVRPCIQLLYQSGLFFHQNCISMQS